MARIDGVGKRQKLLRRSWARRVASTVVPILKGVARICTNIERDRRAWRTTSLSSVTIRMPLILYIIIRNTVIQSGITEMTHPQLPPQQVALDHGCSRRPRIRRVPSTKPRCTAQEHVAERKVRRGSVGVAASSLPPLKCSARCPEQLCSFTNQGGHRASAAPRPVTRPRSRRPGPAQCAWRGSAVAVTKVRLRVAWPR